MTTSDGNPLDPHCERPADQNRESLARGLDASFNRLAEALRTVEDRLRFDSGRGAQARRFRGLRKRTEELRRRCENNWGPLARFRDVAGDPGAPGSESQGGARRDQPQRASVADLISANLARARESSRSIEETLRLGLTPLAADAEQLRYLIYDAEGAVVRLASASERLQAVRLYVLLTTKLAQRALLDTAADCIRGGAEMVQLREKEMSKRELLPLARDLRDLTAEMGALLIINDDIDIAQRCGADGVHLGQEDLHPQEARRLLGGDKIIGLSTHGAEHARRADTEGADYIGVGPIFPTRTKEHRQAVGLETIEAARRESDLPGFAIGSVNRKTLPRVLAAGARRVAVCTGIIAVDDVAGEARWFRDQLGA